jgi:hypothetical protein
VIKVKFVKQKEVVEYFGAKNAKEGVGPKVCKLFLNKRLPKVN